MSGLSLSGDGLSITGGAGTVSLTVGSTAITGGTTGRLLYDNAGQLAEALVTVVSSSQLQLGAADGASPVANTLSFQGYSGVANSGSLDAYIKAPQTTGTGNKGRLRFQISEPAASGSTAGTYSDWLVLSNYQWSTAGKYILFAEETFGGTSGLEVTDAGNCLSMLTGSLGGLWVRRYGAIDNYPGAVVNSISFSKYYGRGYGGAANAHFRYGDAVHTITMGTSDAAAPAAQTLNVQNVVDGTTDTAGANWTLAGSRGTGTGVGGNINLQVALPGSTGTTQNALATMASVSGSTGLLDLTKGTTIAPATAPASPASGWVIYVDSGDGNKLKAKASNGTVVTLGTP